MTHARQYLEQTSQLALALDHEAIERLTDALVTLRARGGRLFLLGVGGSAANCSHAVNDFRKLAGIEAYSPCDNVAELTARVNDEGWPTVFEAWLRTSRAEEPDAVFVMSVGGGDVQRNISPNIVRALDEAKRRKLRVLGIVGRDGGYTKQVGDEVVVVPTVDPAHVTPHAEAFQAVIWHCLVCHPKLMRQENKWESVTRPCPAIVTRAVFLDRDGVILRSIVRGGRPYAPARRDEAEILPRVTEAIDGLRTAGFRTIVVTNQPDVATGVQRRDEVEAIHKWLREALRVDDVRVCDHVDADGCACRKPKPGMLLEAARDWGVDLGQSYMVGDRWRDVDAGRAAGCRTILVRAHYDERQAESPDAVVDSLFEASELILSGRL